MPAPCRHPSAYDLCRTLQTYNKFFSVQAFFSENFICMMKSAPKIAYIFFMVRNILHDFQKPLRKISVNRIEKQIVPNVMSHPVIYLLALGFRERTECAHSAFCTQSMRKHVSHHRLRKEILIEYNHVFLSQTPLNGYGMFGLSKIFGKSCSYFTGCHFSPPFCMMMPAKCLYPSFVI